MITIRTPESPDNKSIKELRNELKDLNNTFKKAISSNERVSLVVIYFAFIQMMIMLFQVFISIKETDGWLIGIIIIILLGVVIIYLFREMNKENTK